jgi:uncharacterized protein YoaH (UPF0181 family)
MSNQKKSENQIQYLPICMCLGMSIGSALGVATDNLSLFMCFGMSIGVGLGAVIDAKNRKTHTDNSAKNEDSPSDEQEGE